MEARAIATATYDWSVLGR